VFDKGEGGDTKLAFEPGRATIAGFHPHGIIPYSAGLMTLSESFVTHAKGVRPRMMTDFMTHMAPLMRDFVQVRIGPTARPFLWILWCRVPLLRFASRTSLHHVAPNIGGGVATDWLVDDWLMIG
jgi:hypothetical protein